MECKICGRAIPPPIRRTRLYCGAPECLRKARAGYSSKYERSEKRSAKYLAWRKRGREMCSAWYIRSSILGSHSAIVGSAIPQALVELKQTHLLIKKELRRDKRNRKVER